MADYTEKWKLYWKDVNLENTKTEVHGVAKMFFFPKPYWTFFNLDSNSCVIQIGFELGFFCRVPSDRTVENITSGLQNVFEGFDLKFESCNKVSTKQKNGFKTKYCVLVWKINKRDSIWFHEEHSHFITTYLF